tara:strand:+ start:621 stop:839 length:219 start_codon:yes stop_codon:yes gene_type:complete
VGVELGVSLNAKHVITNRQRSHWAVVCGSHHPTTVWHSQYLIVVAVEDTYFVEIWGHPGFVLGDAGGSVTNA